MNLRKFYNVTPEPPNSRQNLNLKMEDVATLGASGHAHTLTAVHVGSPASPVSPSNFFSELLH